jgi:hypothetical protein
VVTGNAATMMEPPGVQRHLPLPREGRLMGDTILPSSRKITTNLWFKFSRVIQFYYINLLKIEQK